MVKILHKILGHRNNQYNNIEFKVKIEFNNLFQFLDVIIPLLSNIRLGHTVYWKSTHNNGYLHAQSYHHFSQNFQLLVPWLRDLYICPNPIMSDFSWSKWRKIFKTMITKCDLFAVSRYLQESFIIQQHFFLVCWKLVKKYERFSVSIRLNQFSDRFAKYVNCFHLLKMCILMKQVVQSKLVLSNINVVWKLFSSWVLLSFRWYIYSSLVFLINWS